LTEKDANLFIVIYAIHVLAAAALFGAMFYSLTIVQPNAKKHFKNAQDFEEFMGSIGDGARWKVLSGLGLIAVTGLILIPFHQSATNHLNHVWMALIAGKIIILAVVGALFCYVSWRLWPRRIFAIPEEFPKYQRTFRLLGFVMLTLVGMEFVLAIIAHEI